MLHEMSRQDVIADEAFMVADGGEMPEVAFHSAVYYLTKDAEGPGLELEPDDIALLKEAVVRRYQAIVLRDLDPQNKNTSIYRGLERSAANWQRLQLYARRQKIDLSIFQSEVAQALRNFLRAECHVVINQGQKSCINCSKERLRDYAESLGLPLDEEVAQWRLLFERTYR